VVVETELEMKVVLVLDQVTQVVVVVVGMKYMVHLAVVQVWL